LTTNEVLDPSQPLVAPTTKQSGAPVSLERLTRIYGSTRALDEFSLTIEPGEFVALLGPSGCGKTSALRMVAGFDRPDAGQILVDGVDVSRIPAQKRDMGMVFQSYSLFPNMSARDNVAFGLQLRRQRGAVRRQRAVELLELVGLGEHTTKYPHQLSGGQQQRVALARALAIEPRVLLLDEPLSALDAKVRAELRDQIRAIQQRLDIPTLFVTHDQEEALSMADRVCVMSKGRVEQVASPAELYAHPSTAFVAEFVGVSSRVPVNLQGDHVVLFGREVAVRGKSPAMSDGPIDALLRPEDVNVRVDDSGVGVVQHRSFLGATTRLKVGLADVVVKTDVRSSDADDFDLGTRVSLDVAALDVLVAARRVPASEVNA
jgi:putative spermidine/putrescine transport system ATP-binding protein